MNHPDVRAIEQAAQHLVQGGLVAFPTETVYGLGADAENPTAIARIYAAKQRPAGHPLIVHLSANADPAYWMTSVSSHARRLMDAFWPGPLTLIVPRAAHIPPEVSGGQPTVGLRCPSHPVAQALLATFAALKSGGQGGIAAPSANKFGQVSPTRAEHVRAEFPELGEQELLILEGDSPEVGIESTIVDVSGDDTAVPVILRPGHIRPDQIGRVLGIMPGQAHPASPRVSGTLKAHYAPRTPLSLIEADDLADVCDTVAARYPDASVAALVFRFPEGVSPDRADLPRTGQLPPCLTVAGRRGGQIDYYLCDSEPHLYARQLYGMLRDLDQRGYAALLMEQPPRNEQWRAVNDRLGRAAAAFEA